MAYTCSSRSVASWPRLEELRSRLFLNRKFLPQYLTVSANHSSLYFSVSPPSVSLRGRKLLTASAVSEAEEISDVKAEKHLNENLDAKDDAGDEAGDSEDEGQDLFPVGPKLHVGNLPSNFTSQDVAEIFQKVVCVEMVEVVYDRVTWKSRGFAFVTVSSKQDASKAIQKLDGTEVGGKTIKVGPVRNKVASPTPRSSRSNANKLFIGNLAWTMDSAKLEKAFSECGKVVDVSLPMDKVTGRGRGFGFVTMSSEAETMAAFTKMNGMELEGRQLRVQLAGEQLSV